MLNSIYIYHDHNSELYYWYNENKSYIVINICIDIQGDDIEIVFHIYKRGLWGYGEYKFSF